MTAALRTSRRERGLPLILTDVYYIASPSKINPRKGDHGRWSRLAPGETWEILDGGPNQTDTVPIQRSYRPCVWRGVHPMYKGGYIGLPAGEVRVPLPVRA